MYEAMEIAYYLIDYAYKTEREHYLTGLKMNCFLFIVQGAHLAILDRPAFSDKIYKIGCGVHLDKIYNEFKGYLGLTIPHTHTVVNPKHWGWLLKNLPYYDSYNIKESENERFGTATYMCDNLNKDTEKIIEGVFDNFYFLSLTGLNNLIRNFGCYNETHYSRNAEGYKSNAIKLDMMKKEFVNLLEQKEEK